VAQRHHEHCVTWHVQGSSCRFAVDTLHQHVTAFWVLLLASYAWQYHLAIYIFLIYMCIYIFCMSIFSNICVCVCAIIHAATEVTSIDQDRMQVDTICI
jgi:type II secretory pathway component PulC